MSKRVVLDLCGGSGSWGRPYAQKGYDVRLITLPEDVRLLEIPDEPVHGIIAAPPCTVFSAAGARWQRTEDELRDALSVVDACLRLVVACRPKFWALENPIGKLNRYLGAPRFLFNPCDYGDPYTKRTQLWGEFNVPRFSLVYPSEGSKMHRLPDSKQRQALRSITPAGFARAFYEANP